jgi:hypothetical protein
MGRISLSEIPSTNAMYMGQIMPPAGQLARRWNRELHTLDEIRRGGSMNSLLSDPPVGRGHGFGPISAPCGLRSFASPDDAVPVLASMRR